MNVQHTPGPWSTFKAEHMVFECHTGEAICDLRKVNTTQYDPEEGAANARLIAASPDLLLALEKIYANAAESPEWIRRVAGEAIAKAEGK